jgi:hypothetical protein
MKLLAQNSIDSIFGHVSPPPGMVGGDDPIATVGNIIGFGINIFISIAGLVMLIYLLWGALDWIMSSGDKEKLAKAQNKITNAVIGLIVIFVILSAYYVIAGQMLGIIKVGSDGSWSIGIPTFK